MLIMIHDPYVTIHRQQTIKTNRRQQQTNDDDDSENDYTPCKCQYICVEVYQFQFWAWVVPPKAFQDVLADLKR